VNSLPAIQRSAISILALALSLGLFATAPAVAQESAVQASFESELGAIKLLSHSYRVGASPANTTFDFVNMGGQEILFPFSRLTGIVTFAGDHQLRFLYQPLEIRTEVDFPSTVTVDDKDFLGPTAMAYSFPFYRATYLYRFLDNEGSWLAAGGAIQLRNASIRFASLDGATLAVSQNLGVVPALALAGRVALGPNWFAAFDATGIYASSALFNGANFTFEGSILDASARIGFGIGEGKEFFLNARFFGGTAAGISGYERGAWSNSTSPETENRIASVTLTLGATLR